MIDWNFAEALNYVQYCAQIIYRCGNYFWKKKNVYSTRFLKFPLLKVCSRKMAQWIKEAVSRPVRGVSMSHCALCLPARLPRLFQGLKWGAPCMGISTVLSQQDTHTLPTRLSLLLRCPWPVHAGLLAGSRDRYFRQTTQTLR